MTYDTANEHAAFRESIAAALAGGLSAAEQAAFDAHRAVCADCATELERAREAEARMTALFAPALPPVGFEDRLVHRLRENTPTARRLGFVRPNWRIHPALGKAVAGVAAAIVLAGVGYAVTGALEQSNSVLVREASNLRHLGQNLLAYSNDNRGAGRRDQLGTWFSVAGDFDGDKVQKAGKDVGGGKRFDGANDFYFGDGHVTWEANPFPGVSRDNIMRGSAAVEGTERGRAAGGGGGGGGTSDAAGESLGLQATNAPPADLPVLRATTPPPAAPSAQTPPPAAADGKWFKPTQLGDIQQEKNSKGLDVMYDANDSLLATQEGQQSTDAAGAKPVPVQQEVAPGQPAAPPVKPPPESHAGDTIMGRRVLAGNLVQETAPPPPPSFPPPPNTPATTQVTQRKVIRNGDLAFEVDRFDSAFAQVSKLTTEAGGYIGTTSSEKLPNGKVQGKVTVRVPPDRLDTLVLQLRGIGDLKSQSLEAQDVSKKYTDLESQLRAARAMEERLIGIIKEGKGQIKDLLAAEKELGNWRTKVEELTGEMKYYDNLVSLATLNLTLTERDIETPATAYESENVEAGVESEDVENARAAALKAIEEAKGRVVQSDLKRYDAGQFGATIVAEVPPDTAGPLLDRLKQIGKVARLDVQRKQTAEQKKSNAVSHAPVRVEKRDTRFNLSVYNLANVAPRQTATLNLAADDVEKAYQAIIDRVVKAGGRIVSSNLNRQKPEQTTGTIAFEIPSAQAEAITNDLRAAGESMRLTLTENPDVQNVTTAKRGFNISLVATAAVAPRETTTIQLAATDVAQAREKILAVATTQAAQVRASQLNENDRQNVSATLELDVKRTALPAVEKALADAGQIVRRNVARSTDAENTLDTKVRLSLTLLPADRLPPRETTTLAVELSDVESAMASLQTAAVGAGGRVVISNLQKDRDGRSMAKVAVDVPLDKSGEIVRATRELGVVRAIDASKDLQVPPGGLARARIDVTFANADTLVAPERGVFASIRRGLSTSLEGLMMSLQFIIIGLCFVLPWALVLYAAWRLIKRRRRSVSAPMPATA